MIHLWAGGHSHGLLRDHGLRATGAPSGSALCLGEEDMVEVECAMVVHCLTVCAMAMFSG